MGTDVEDDTYVIGEDFPRIAEIRLTSPDHGDSILATVANGDGGELSFFLMRQDGSWIKLAGFEEEIKRVNFPSDGKTLFLLSTSDTPSGTIFKMPVDSTDIRNATELARAREGSVEDIVISGSRLFVSEVAGGPSRFSVYEQNCPFMGEIPPPTNEVYSINEMVSAGNGFLIVLSESFLSPPSSYIVDPSLSVI